MDLSKIKEEKKRLKKDIQNILGKNVGIRSNYDESLNSWNVAIGTSFDIPNGLEKVINGFDEDILNPKIISYLEAKKQELAKILGLKFDLMDNAVTIQSFNFTQPIPPLISTINGLEGGIRLKTPEEKQRIREQFPALVDMLDYDEKVLNSGFFEFVGVQAIEHDGFILKKYASIRVVVLAQIYLGNEQVA